MNSLRSTGRTAIFFAIAAYVYGAVLMAIGFVWNLLTSTEPRSQAVSWWLYLLAPLAVGLVAFALEWVGMLVTKGDDVSHPLRKRLPRFLAIFLLLTALALGPAIWKIASQH